MRFNQLSELELFEINNSKSKTTRIVTMNKTTTKTKTRKNNRVYVVSIFIVCAIKCCRHV